MRYLKQFGINYSALDNIDKQQLHYMFPAHGKNYIGVDHAVQDPPMFLQSYYTRNKMFRIDISKRGLADSDEMILYLFNIVDISNPNKKPKIRFSIEFRENINYMQYSEYLYFLNYLIMRTLYTNNTTDTEAFSLLHHKYYRNTRNLSMMNNNYIIHVKYNTYAEESEYVNPIVENPKFCIDFYNFKSNALAYDKLDLNKIKKIESERKMDMFFELRLSVKEMMYSFIPFLQAAAQAFDPRGLRISGYGALTEADINRQNTYYNNINNLPIFGGNQ